MTFGRPYFQANAPPPPGPFAATVLATSPTAYWRLGEPSGSNAVEQVGALDGTYLGSPTLGVAGITSDGDTAVTFASGTGVSRADNAVFDLGTGDFTVMYAVKHSTWTAGTNT